MDLNIAGRRAIVCASSRGLGKACALSLARAGVHVVINGRDEAVLAQTCAELRAVAAGEVTPVAADICTLEGRDEVLRSCPRADILVNNAGGPPPGDFRDWDRAVWLKALNNNMLTPIELIKATVDGMCQRGFGRIVNITSAAVKSPIATLGLSNGARSGLTGFVAGLARQVAGHGVTVNNLLPGPFDTERLRQNIAHGAGAAGVDYEAERARRLRTVPAGRFGEPQEFGELCAYLCSRQAGFITGQNLVIDGGSYPGTL